MSGVTGAPRVVALVPAWSAAAFIAETLDALVAQTCPNLEILVSDDASPDETAILCDRYAERDPRIRVIRQSRNLGWTGNVNALLREANGDYFVFAFQDDLLAPDYIERCVAALEANPNAILAFSDIALVNQDGSREFKSYAVLDGLSERLARARRVAAQQGSWWIPNRGVFRARAARVIGGLRTHRAGEFSADWPWLLHLSLLGEFIRIPERLCTKIYQERSLSRGWDFGLRSWIAVTGSASTMIARSGISMREVVAIHGTLAAFLWRHVRRSLLRTVGRALRRLGLRRPPPVPESPR